MRGININLLKQLEAWVTKLKHSSLFNSLKFKFLVINVIVSFFLIIIIAFVLYETVNYTIYSRFESDLTSNANNIVSIMGNTTIPSSSKIIYFNQVNLPGYLILILNSGGQIIEESGKISVASYFLDKLSNVAQKYHSAHFFKEHINKDTLLMLSVPI